jgi:ankyrin repeat protein
MWAAIKGHEAAMKVLLQKGADPTVHDWVSE